MRNHKVSAGVVALVAMTAAACSDSTGPGGTQQVRIAFSAGGTQAALAGSGASLLGDEIVLQGTNGTLVIQDLRVIVSEFELDRVSDDACAVEDDDSCESFEAPPAFVDVPLAGGQAVVVTGPVAPDTYDELEFEIEDLEDDEEDPAKAQQISNLLATIRGQFADWPRDASMLVTGTFTPTGGQPIPFRVYFEAEVEIEMALNPPVTVTEGTAGTFTVTLAPELWFRSGGGTVMNLAALDYAATGKVVEFKFEMEDGFTEVEFDD